MIKWAKSDGQKQLHGGLLFTLMDEAVAWSLYYGRAPGRNGQSINAV
ncbi:hypothetical protein BH20ACI3_BH20ACI3_35220 [soil metagenome]